MSPLLTKNPEFFDDWQSHREYLSSKAITFPLLFFILYPSRYHPRLLETFDIFFDKKKKLLNITKETKVAVSIFIVHEWDFNQMY